MLLAPKTDELLPARPGSKKGMSILIWGLTLGSFCSVIEPSTNLVCLRFQLYLCFCEFTDSETSSVRISAGRLCVWTRFNAVHFVCSGKYEMPLDHKSSQQPRYRDDISSSDVLCSLITYNPYLGRICALPIQDITKVLP